jgi:hypothetical protein
MGADGCSMSTMQTPGRLEWLGLGPGSQPVAKRSDSAPDVPDGMSAVGAGRHLNRVPCARCRTLLLVRAMIWAASGAR